MSASLVGSEMCIRDRSAPGLRTRRHQCRSARSRRPWPRPARPPCRPLPCLLYTSDAADDM
eukprot:9771086-Alexandrium_andersonii.AAC.1